jgi:hypothetical protein
MSDESWVFSRPQAKGHARGQVQVSVSDQEVTIEHRSPNGGLERFEILMEQAVEAIGAVIKPQAIWGSVVTLEYQADIGGDARKAILGPLEMLGDEEGVGKLGAFERPCHFVGLRLGFPAFQYDPQGDEEEEDEEGAELEDEKTAALAEGQLTENPTHAGGAKEPAKGADWHATLTLQSLQDDPKSLSVEVGGRWIGGVPWEHVKETLPSRLWAVDEFLKTKTSDFLEQFRSEE